jgi:phage anti-repressor protein
MRKLSKVELLKVFTKIPNDFIDDFYDILKNKDADFPIDLDIVTKWLMTRKKDLIDTLKRSYKVNIDYTITKYNTNKPGSNNYKKTMLTIDCFKRLCMRSRSLKAEEVRSYFIELDDFIAHYSDQISDGIIRDIEKVVKRVNKNPNTDGPGYIYAIRASSKVKGLVKVGETKNLIDRLKTYNTGRAEDVELLYAFKVQQRKQVEMCIKGLMENKRYQKRKEIYEVDLDILKRIINGCNKMSMEMKMNKPQSTLDGKYYLIFMKQDGGDFYESMVV